MMRRSLVLSFSAILAGAILIGAPVGTESAGTIKGHVRLGGKLPGNSLIRMGVDPKCADMYRGKQAVQEEVKATVDGSLANVFVRLEGTFPSTPVPKTPAVIEQKGCFYVPRVSGVRVGQLLEIRNSDNLFHNVHSVSVADNEFNFGQARVGIANSFKMKNPEIMMRLGCDVHRWMRAYVGVVTNPYFAVSDTSGAFTIANVPSGTYTIVAWHERYGPIKKSVKVTAGTTVTVDFGYTGTESTKK